LAQEARGAAKALREGVSALTQPPPGREVVIQQTPEVETTLDTLDDAIGRLGELQLGTPSKARRGRIDLAALLCDMAPNARIAMEPGAGTEVFGEESELRRMLHLLVSQTNAGPTSSGDAGGLEVEIRRQGEWVKISAELGPDASPTAELERRWLSRMAVRHGGRLELEGGLQSMWLPADGASDQREVAELRRELEQAQQLGEVYARELAQVVASGDLPSEQPPAREDTEARFETMVTAVSAMERGMRAWLDGLRSELDAKNAASLRERVEQRVAKAQALMQELERVAAYPLDETERSADLAALARDAVAAVEARAARRGIRLETELPAELAHRTRPAAFTLALRALLDHALLATSRGQAVRIELVAGPPPVLTVVDGGPGIPEAARADLLSRRIDPTAFGRPDGISLLAASLSANRLAAQIAIGSNAGQTAFVLTL
jgi:signal transduction histidine kinase